MTNNTAQMQAITIPEFGGAEVLRFAELDVPEPGPGQVSIDVAYAGANFAEVLYRQGVVDVPLPFVPGIEVSGRIRAVGPGVDGLRVGQPVAALTIVAGGGYAEVVVTAADLVAPLDEHGPDLDLAAALPSNSTTAFLVLDRVARIEPGEKVLVHAAAGGVGSQLGQVARLLGAGRVVGTVGSPAKIDVAKRFGYDEVVLRDRFDNAGEFDIVVDMVGGANRRTGLDGLAPMGRLIVMGNASGAEDVGVSANELWFTNKTVSGFNLAAFSAAYPEHAGRALRRAVAAAARGDLHVQVESLRWDQVADVHRRIETAATTGKIVLEVAAR
ncbi:NADPH2:quinone reductase [Saccharopolyspora shandongensis]|uniref:NADPH2:quinone reductase n=1 Tax=Saccharopolyspora shandongensis TaxID=418495 RepID=A0A1H3GN47_9PSEU|nr:zinc-binding dehydrogenase [Saccharopolyspora shandongensis]SDY04537.1 NADPH2:quinone reductase [Saccharopolyspora shandongensis]